MYYKAVLLILFSPVICAIDFSSYEEKTALILSSGSSLTFESVPNDTVSDVKALIDEEMSIYSSDFLNKFVSNIYVVSNLKINGYDYGGSYNSRSIFLSIPEYLGGFITFTEGSRGIFHHELASFVFNENFGNKIAWSVLIPRNWESVTYGVYSQNQWGIKDGFISPYGTTSLGNDFSEYAKIIFTNPVTVIEKSNEYEIVREKTCLFRTIYTELDPKTEIFFNNNGIDKLCVNMNFDTVRFNFESNTLQFE